AVLPCCFTRCYSCFHGLPSWCVSVCEKWYNFSRHYPTFTPVGQPTDYVPFTNNVPFKDGDFIDITCPFCGWTDGAGRYDEEIPKTWRKCVWCKKRYRPRQGDITIKIKD
ncbi:MAG: hypothetical protein IJI45_13190, partial [Anaerolineaceae bacterium]|nr:hypothetical protein [Anaerolineaceae bacterium]